MEIDKKELKVIHFIPPVIILALFLNPYIEAQQTNYQWLFMTAHYALFIAGLLLMYKIVRGSPLLLIPSAFLVSFWHYPYFFALAAAYPFYRAINDLSFIVAGALAGISAYRLSTLVRFSLIILWMIVDTILSLVFVLQIPVYSNLEYSFSPYSVSQELDTGIAMFIVMSVIIVYIFARFLKELLY